MTKPETITRAHLADAVYNQIGLSYVESMELVGSFFEVVKVALANDETLKIPHFGSFSVRQKKERIGRNPKTKVAKVISARRVLNFSASSVLRKKINNNNDNNA